MWRKHGKRNRSARNPDMVRCGVASVSFSCSHRSPPCPLASTWRILKEPSRRILWEPRNGPVGFRAVQGFCDQMSPSMLSQRLSLLQTMGLLYHTEESPYSLTGTGQELLQALAPLQAWAQQWAEQLRGQEETESAHTDLERRRLQMSSAPGSQPTFLGIAPRFVTRDLGQALAFYEHLGFQTTY